MTIRNSETGEVREIDPSQATQYGIAQSVPQSNSSGGLRGALNALNPFPQTTKTLTELPRQLASSQAQMPSSKGNLPQSIKNAAQLTGQFAQGIFNPGQLLETGLTAAGVRAVKVVPTAAKFALNPSKFLGGQLEKKIVNAGTVPNELLEKYLGTIRTPNPNLYQKVALNDIGPLQKTRQILMNTLSQGKDIGGTPTYADILAKRTGAYGVAKKSFFEPGSQEQRLAKNLGKAYTDIIHAGVPGTKTIDKTLSIFHQTNNPWLKAGIGAYLLDKVGGHVTQGLQNLFAE